MKTLTRIEACQVLLDGGELEYSLVNSDYWSDVTNRDLVFTLDDNYIFRGTPNYKYVEYTLNEIAASLKTSEHKEVWVYGDDCYMRLNVFNSGADKIAIRAFRGEKFYKRVEPE